jgi:hypothetical protein
MTTSIVRDFFAAVSLIMFAFGAFGFTGLLQFAL